MTDDAQQTQSSTAQDPLAVLEGILQDAKKKGGAKSASDSGQPVADQAPDAKTQAEDQQTKEALAAKRAEEQQQAERQRLKQISQYRQQMQSEIQNTDAYKNRVAQDAADQQNKDSKVSGDGFEINQIQHKKI